MKNFILSARYRPQFRPTPDTLHKYVVCCSAHRKVGEQELYDVRKLESWVGIGYTKVEACQFCDPETNE